MVFYLYIAGARTAPSLDVASGKKRDRTVASNLDYYMRTGSDRKEKIGDTVRSVRMRLTHC